MMKSSISVDHELDEAEAGHAWRGDGGVIFVTVRLSGATFYFTSAEYARDVAAACSQAADAHDKLAAESGARA